MGYLNLALSSSSGSQADGAPVSGGGLSQNGKFSYGYASSPGKRSSMEDFYETRIDGVDGEIVGLFGVFDGHGGARAAEYVKQNLFSNLISHPKFISDTKSAIADAYNHTDSEFLKSENNQNRDAGSTASTAILVGDRLLVANVGDSRAVICRGGSAIAVSRDHKPDQTDERQRIEEAGGFVMWAGTWRVGGVLAVSRAFGDRLLKQYVVADPEIQVSGKVTYNGHSMHEFVPQRTAAYISQKDIHIPEMTVRETLAFSARCQGAGSLHEMLIELSRREKEANIKPDHDLDVFMKTVGMGGKDTGVVTDYIMKRNSFAYIFKATQLMIIAMITMTVFLRTNKHRNSVADGGIYMGAAFFTTIVIMFNGMAELAMTVWKLPVFYKHKDLLFYPAWAYALPTWILKIPISFVEVGVWVYVSYYAIGFDPSVQRFLKQYLLLVALSQLASGLFRFIAALGRNMTTASTFGTFVLIIVVVLGGFILSRGHL